MRDPARTAGVQRVPHRGGRFYCHGNSFQNMPKQDRRALELVIDGAPHPMVEIDYSNLHIAMAYAEAEQRMPAGDQYAIKGFDRGLVKLAVNTVFNARLATAVSSPSPRSCTPRML